MSPWYAGQNVVHLGLLHNTPTDFVNRRVGKDRHLYFPRSTRGMWPTWADQARRTAHEMAMFVIAMEATA